MRYLTLVLVVVLLGAACGDSADTTTTTPAPEATTATTQPPATTQATTTTTVEEPDTTTTKPEIASSVAAPSTTTVEAVVVERDLPYYKADGGLEASLDVYHPSVGVGLPVVVIFHRNPIFGGRKEGVESLARMVAERGAVVFAPTYGSGQFDPDAVVEWFTGQGPCAVWTAADLAADYSGDPETLILFGQVTGSFPASSATFSPPDEAVGCLASPADVPIEKSIFFDQDWFFVPSIWDSVLTEDSDYFASIQPWDNLDSPKPTRITVAVGELSESEVFRPLAADSYSNSEWVRIRDPEALLAEEWTRTGGLDDGEMSFTEVSEVLTNLLIDAGWDVEFVEIHGVGHALSTAESKTQVLELIFEDIEG